MTDIRGTIQTVLDNALSANNVRIYWPRKTETTGEDPDEYVVFTLDGDPADAYADNEPLIRSANVAIRYYYRDSLLDTTAGRAQIKARENTISNSLLAAGWTLPNGFFDVGDIDDIGFGTTIFEAYYSHFVGE